MGTSNRRIAPKSKEWSKAKRQATGLVSTGTSSSTYNPSSAIGSYLSAVGGSPALVGGGGGGGGGGKKSRGGSAISRSVSSAQTLGSFLRDVSIHGLDEALRRRGIHDLIGKPPSEVMAGLVDKLSDSGASLSGAIIRAAEAETLGEMFDESIDTYESLRDNWESSIDGGQLLTILVTFLANVVFQQWVSDMSEKLENGVFSADAFLGKEATVKEFVKSQISFELGRIDPLELDWQGQDGYDLIRETLKSAIELMEE